MIWDILAFLVVVCLTLKAFDPKYRYNEHQSWEPTMPEIWLMALTILFMLWRLIY